MHRLAWWGFIAGLLVVTGAAYFPVLDCGLVWDDWTNIATDPPFTARGRELIARAFTDVRAGHWQPLAWLSLAADHALFGSSPRGFHLTNVLIHMVNVLLFALAGRRLLRAVAREEAATSWVATGALIAAAIFALHPLRVETVAWITERRHLLSATFFLVALILWLRALGDGRSGRPHPGRAAAAVGCYGLSLLATPLGIALPAVLLVADIWPLRRLTPSDGWRRAASLVVEKLPMIVLAAIFSATALAAQHTSGGLPSVERFSLGQRLAQAAYGAMFYPRAMFARAWYPLYERPAGLDPVEPRFALSALAFVALGAALVLLRRTFPAGLATWLSYLLLLAPVSGLTQAGIQLVADRYSYLSCLPFALLLGAGVATGLLAPTIPVARWMFGLSFVLIVSSWTVETREQTRVWANDVSMWTHVLRGGPSAQAHNNLSQQALKSGQLGVALEHAARAIDTAPGYGRAWRAIITILEHPQIGRESDRLKNAARVLEARLPAQEGAAEAWYALGLARAAAGEAAAAVPAFERAVAADPSFSRGWRGLGLALAVAGRPSEAISALERGAIAVPDDPVIPELRRAIEGGASNARPADAARTP